MEELRGPEREKAEKAVTEALASMYGGEWPLMHLMSKTSLI
jgi:hypothetical protein